MTGMRKWGISVVSASIKITPAITRLEIPAPTDYKETAMPSWNDIQKQIMAVESPYDWVLSHFRASFTLDYRNCTCPQTNIEGAYQFWSHDMVELSGVFKDSMNLKNEKDRPKRMEFTTFLKLFPNVRIVFNNQRTLGERRKLTSETYLQGNKRLKFLLPCKTMVYFYM